MAEKKNKTLEKARFEMNYLTGKEEVRRLAELREKWAMDYADTEVFGFDKGMKEGLKKEKERIAKQMLKMKLGIDIIMEATGLSKEEIEALILCK